jgi:hypothetical protein
MSDPMDGHLQPVLSDDEIRALDDATHFHESLDWTLRFARAVEQRVLAALAAAERERDALVRERDAVLAANRDCLLHYDDARAERDAMAALLREARDGLAGGLWDYGPGQDEHDRCNELIEKLDAALSGKEPT